MNGFWLRLGSLAMVLGLIVGCRNSPPELKPPTVPDEYNVPPSEARFDSPDYPKEALARDDLAKKLRENGPITMPKGFGPGGGGGGMGGVNGMR